MSNKEETKIRVKHTNAMIKKLPKKNHRYYELDSESIGLRVHVELNGAKSFHLQRYKLFVIEKNTFESKFNLDEYGISLIKEEKRIVVDNLKLNGEAKKSGFKTGDYISEFKIENLDRPNKGIVYPVAILLLIIFGYLNYRRKE